MNIINKLIINIRSIFLVFVLSLFVSVSSADEFTLEEGDPIPVEVEELETPLEIAFEEETDSKYGYDPIFRNVINVDDKDPFIRDTKAKLVIRTAYYESYDVAVKHKKSGAIGGEFDVKSGYYNDTLMFGFAAANSAKLYGPKEKGGKKLLKNDQSGFEVVNEAYARLKYSETELTLFRHALNYPFLSKSNDGKIVPRSHEAYTIETRDVENFTFVGSFVTKFKNHIDTKFRSPTRAVGIEDKNKELVLLGAFYEPNDSFTAGLYNLHAIDLFNTIYGDSSYTFSLLNDELGVEVAGQYIYQESVGDKLLPGLRDLVTYAYGLRVAADYKGFLLTLAVSHVANREEIQAPWGGNPIFTSMQVTEFSNPGETGYVARLTYDYSRIGLNGLTTFIALGYGDTPNGGENRMSNEREVNVGADYRFQEDILKGLWIRGRAGWLDQDKRTGTDVNSYEVYINYEIPLF